MQYWKNLYDQSSHNVVSSSIRLTQGSEENIMRIKKKIRKQKYLCKIPREEIAMCVPRCQTFAPV